MAGYVGQVQYYSTVMATRLQSTVLSWLPVWHRYRNAIANYVGQVKYCHGYLSGARTVEYCTVMAACLAQIQKCHVR